MEIAVLTLDMPPFQPAEEEAKVEICGKKEHFKPKVTFALQKNTAKKLLNKKGGKSYPHVYILCIVYVI